MKPLIPLDILTLILWLITGAVVLYAAWSKRQMKNLIRKGRKNPNADPENTIGRWN